MPSMDRKMGLFRDEYNRLEKRSFQAPKFAIEIAVAKKTSFSAAPP